MRSMRLSALLSSLHLALGLLITNQSWLDISLNDFLTRTHIRHSAGDQYPANESTGVLAVFDLDGTLLVSAGREIITSPDGECMAAVHPLVEPAFGTLVKPGGNNTIQRSYRYAGEEDSFGDEYELLDRACIIEPVAERLRSHLARGDAVAILSARAHDPRWLANVLTRKLHLTEALRPELIKCVYSRSFEATLPMRGANEGWSVPRRKAHAFADLLRATASRESHFFDDMADNLHAVSSFAAEHFPLVAFHSHPVTYEEAVAACASDGVDIREFLHPQCRHGGGLPLSLPNSEAPQPLTSLTARLLESPVARQRIGGYTRPSMSSMTLSELPP